MRNKLTAAQIAEKHQADIDLFRKVFGSRETLSDKHADKLIEILDRALTLPKEEAFAFFECLVAAQIRFVSPLAQNRLNRLRNSAV